MTLNDAISGIDHIKPNGYSQSEKIKWLSTLDCAVKTEIIDKYEQSKDTSFLGYDDSTPLSTSLLVPSPYDDIYLRYLEMQIDYSNNEYGKYNNSKTLYNSAFSAFKRHYNQTHMPKGKKLKFF